MNISQFPHGQNVFMTAEVFQGFYCIESNCYQNRMESNVQRGIRKHRTQLRDETSSGAVRNTYIIAG